MISRERIRDIKDHLRKLYGAYALSSSESRLGIRPIDFSYSPHTMLITVGELFDLLHLAKRMAQIDASKRTRELPDEKCEAEAPNVQIVVSEAGGHELDPNRNLNVHITNIVVKAHQVLPGIKAFDFGGSCPPEIAQLLSRLKHEELHKRSFLESLVGDWKATESEAQYRSRKMADWKPVLEAAINFVRPWMKVKEGAQCEREDPDYKKLRHAVCKLTGEK